MKVLKKILIILGIIVAFLVIAGLVYKLAFGQRKAEVKTLGNPDAEFRLLIATQGSNFKDKLLEEIETELAQKNIYVKVDDVSFLKNINIEDWSFILVMTAIEAGKIHGDAQEFILSNYNFSNLYIVLTSGGGKDWSSYYDKPVDSISSASKTDDINSIKQGIINRLDSVISN
jgi:hypothetical protein